LPTTALGLGLVLTAAACARGSRRAESAANTGPSRVEAVFDLPREYRAFGDLPCTEARPLVYLVTDEDDLYGFQPDDLTFQKVGILRCPAAPGATPNSLAVDRKGTAWVHYTDGSLHRASTRDARCVATAFGAQHNGFFQPGVAFASTGPDLIDETLFLWGGTTVTGPFTWRGAWAWIYEDHGLARLDRATSDLDVVGYGDPRPARPPHVGMSVTDGGAFDMVGEVSVEMRGGGSVHDDVFSAASGGTIRITLTTGAPPLHEVPAELTGTGSGKLYGFFRTVPATLAEIDPATGQILDARRLQGVDGFSGWAFSFWRGDFYLFWAREKETSHATRVSGRDGSLDEVVRDVGFRVMGAGVSTCAPLSR
jgi:hypothetical protein